jgi:sec-independent protein translocase protein TatC
MAPDSEHLAEGTLLSHLLELRTRLIRALAAVAVAFVPCAWFANQLFEWLSQPRLAKLPANGQLIATAVTSPFIAPFKLAFVVALFAAIPYVLYQVWIFVAPGLYRHEKRFALPLLFSSVLLFYAGASFAYFVVFPLMFQFLVGAAPQGVAVMTDMQNYLDFVLTMFFAFGVAFEVPIAVVLLAKTGVVDIRRLQRARGYVLIGIFIVAAILTPPDAIAQSIMAVPMYLLYEAGIVLARILVRPASQGS